MWSSMQNNFSSILAHAASLDRPRRLTFSVFHACIVHLFPRLGSAISLRNLIGYYAVCICRVLNLGRACVEEVVESSSGARCLQTLRGRRRTGRTATLWRHSAFRWRPKQHPPTVQTPPVADHQRLFLPQHVPLHSHHRHRLRRGLLGYASAAVKTKLHGSSFCYVQKFTEQCV